MPRITIRMLGPMTVSDGNGQPLTFPYEKVRALLAFLAAQPCRAHPRSRIAGVLWPEQGERKARHSLSQALSVLRREIDDRDPDAPLLVVSRDAVKFAPDDSCSVDLLRFRELLRLIDSHAHAADVNCSECAHWVNEAIESVSGTLLEDLDVGDSEEFEEWLRAQQATVQQEFDRVLQLGIQTAEASGDLNRARDLARRRVDLDDWDEGARRTLMRLMAASGKRAAAIEEFNTFRSALEHELGVEPEAETVALYQRIKSGLEGPATFVQPAVHLLPSARSLPEPSTRFIGREAELEHLVALLASPDVRLITLTGPGGIGKTRLALEAARSVRDLFPDGVHYVSMLATRPSEQVASFILGALQVHVPAGSDPFERLISQLSEQRSLLILDSFEHVLDSGALIGQLIRSVPSLHVMTTSRERLNLSAETVFEVDGLSLPEEATSAGIARSGAGRLFLQRARQHMASFLPTDLDAPAIYRICHLTGGMPLGIELAAAWIPVLSPLEIASEIAGGLDFLSSTMRDLPERHRSIRAVVERSWELLTETEQRAYRRLSVFRGGFTRDAASFVAGATLPDLSALVRKSLLRRDTSGRYDMHELIRQYGIDRLRKDDPEASVVLQRHCVYFTRFLSARQVSLEGHGQEQALEEITRDFENLRDAWRYAADAAQHQVLLRTAHSLWLFFEITSRYIEGAGEFSFALDALRQNPGSDAAYRLALVRVQVRHWGMEYRLRGVESMASMLEEVLPAAEALDDPFELGILYNFLALPSVEAKNHSLAEARLQRSLDHFTRAGHTWGIAYSTNDLGQIQMLQGDHGNARERYRASLSMFEDLGDRRGASFALRNLGLVEHLMGNVDIAMELLERSAEIRRSIGNEWGIAESFMHLGVVLRDNSRHSEAEHQFLEALRIVRDIGAMNLARDILAEYALLASKFRTGLDTGTSSANGIGEGGLTGSMHLAKMVDQILSDESSEHGPA